MPLYEPASTANPSKNGFRLTGVSATPVMTADSTALGTIYLTPYTDNRIALYNGASWDSLTSAEVSLAVTGRTTDLPFDIFGYDNAGVVTLEFTDWTNATTRATGLTRQDGVWCKTGTLTRRYLGTCRPRSATTFHWVTIGSNLPCKFDLWNTDNRVEFEWDLLATTNSWTYTTATWRQCQASTNYQIDVVAGLQESNLRASLYASSSNSGFSTNDTVRSVALGLDSTTTPGGVYAVAGDPSTVGCTASRGEIISIGRHFLAWLEYSTAADTTTWFGDNGGTTRQSGVCGTWIC